MIVGLNKLDSGHLSVFGGYPGDGVIEIPGKKVGYMPQVRNWFHETFFMEHTEEILEFYFHDFLKKKKLWTLNSFTN